MLEATNTPPKNDESAAPVNPALAAEARIARVAVTVFPLLVVLAGVVGFLIPDVFKPMGVAVPYLLGVIMFCMGLTLTPPDFASVARRPWAVALGIVAHYVIMPGAGWLIAVLLQLPPELAVGLILVGCAPSGTASNVMAFLAKGDVALSVAVASVSTLIAPLVTPALTLFLAGSFLHIDAGAMVLDIVKTVLLPVIAGLLARLTPPIIKDRKSVELGLSVDLDGGRNINKNNKQGAGRGYTGIKGVGSTRAAGP